MSAKTEKQEHILESWRRQWPQALALWSPYVKLQEPRFCVTAKEVKEEGLSGSFAMIRFKDHQVVLDVEQIAEWKLEDFALEVLAHEIGHHVYAPANFGDQLRLLARLRASLPGLENEAPQIANLYTDLLINDRLQRLGNLRLSEVYVKLKSKESRSKLWTFYMRTYEILWALPKGTLCPKTLADETVDADAALGSRLLRSYAREWLQGAGRFGALCYPYLLEEKEAAKKAMQPFMDTQKSGEGEEIPAGFSEEDSEEQSGAVDPREEELQKAKNRAEKTTPEKTGTLPDLQGGDAPKQRYREPQGYVDLMQQADPKMTAKEAVIRYYRDIALPHLVPFPKKIRRGSAELLPEGLSTWSLGEPLEEIDWFESLSGNPRVVPGLSTMKREYGEAEDQEPKTSPVDLYVGVDCSGSMLNPQHKLSWPVVAGTVLALSALRVGSRVKVVLSGEPGQYLETEDFLKDEKNILGVLTSYLGTGYTFGIPRLQKTFDPKKTLKRAVHIVIVTDDDIFAMLGDKQADNWKVAEDTLRIAAGGGTLVLHSRTNWRRPECERLRNQGWDLYFISQIEDMLEFATRFSRKHYSAFSTGI